MLTKQETRISVDDVINHEWIRNNDPNPFKATLSSFILSRITSFSKAKKFKRAVLLFIVANLTNKEVDRERN